MDEIGIVLIGRNEGDRLLACLNSVKNAGAIVYVDSGSQDNSLNHAESVGAMTISLDMSLPFTAARARNIGAETLIKKFPAIKYIQFVDGDCEVQSGWITDAKAFLDSHEKFAVVCGRRRERYPQNSVYNKLCDIEWNTLVGEAKACGGDALIRVEAFKAVEGYRNDLIAGEEPEMCFRMRQLGWKIMRLDKEMTLHDAAMTKFSQWWKRHKRAGHAYAEAYYLHGQTPERFKMKENRSIIFWSGLLPCSLIGAAISPLFVGLLIFYPVQVLRLSLRDKSKYENFKLSLIVAASNIVAKFPQMSGWISFNFNRLRGISRQLIEYK